MLHVERLGTTSVTARLPNPIVEYIDESEWANRSEFLRHWANVGWRVSRDPELAEALDWALDRPEQEPDVPPHAMTAVVYSYDSIVWPEGPRGPAVMSHWEAEPEDIVAEVLPPEPVQKDELTTLRESQLEDLRSRIR